MSLKDQDWWKPLSEYLYNNEDLIAQWNKCPNCGEHPRVWAFDNGLHATCVCAHSKHECVSAESVMSYYHRMNRDFTDYLPEMELRKAWNKYLETRIVEKLPEGRW